MQEKSLAGPNWGCCGLWCYTFIDYQENRVNIDIINKSFSYPDYILKGKEWLDPRGMWNYPYMFTYTRLDMFRSLCSLKP